MNIKLTKVKLHFEAVHTPTLIHWLARGFHHVSLKLYELELIFLRKKNASLACLVSAQITILWGFAFLCKTLGFSPFLSISIVLLWQICVFLVKEIVKVWETVVWCNIQWSLSQVTMSTNFDDFYWKCTFLAERYKLKVCEDFSFFFLVECQGNENRFLNIWNGEIWHLYHSEVTLKPCTIFLNVIMYIRVFFIMHPLDLFWFYSPDNQVQQWNI